MFRAAYRSYQELQTVLAASGLYIHVVTGCCPRWMGSHPAWWAVCRSKHVELSINFGIINSITRLHLVGYFYWFIMIRLFIFLLNFEKCVLNSNTPAYVVNCIFYIFSLLLSVYILAHDVHNNYIKLHIICYNYTYTYTVFVLCTVLYVARMHTKFCRIYLHHIVGRSGLV